MYFNPDRRQHYLERKRTGKNFIHILFCKPSEKQHRFDITGNVDTGSILSLSYSQETIVTCYLTTTVGDALDALHENDQCPNCSSTYDNILAFFSLTERDEVTRYFRELAPLFQQQIKIHEGDYIVGIVGFPGEGVVCEAVCSRELRKVA